jgi:hypothetical protein
MQLRPATLAAAPLLVAAVASAAPTIQVGGDVRDQANQLADGIAGPVSTGFIQVAPEAPGRLALLGGAVVSANGFVDIGNSSASAGNLRVEGFGSTLNVGGDLVAARSGAALVEVVGGGFVNVSQGRVLVADEFGPGNGLVRVNGFGSTLAGDSLLAATNNTNAVAQVEIAFGGRASFQNEVRIGSAFGGAADVSVGGSGASLTAGQGFLATGGTLRLNVDGAASFDSSLELTGGTLALDGGRVASGQVTVDAGTISGQGTVSAPLRLRQAGRIDATGGTLRFDGSPSTNTVNALEGQVDVAAGATVDFSGGTFVSSTASIVSDGGTLRSSFWDLQGSLAALDGTTSVAGFFNLGEPNVSTVARVSAATGGDVRFLDDVTNNGLFDVRPGSTATFVGNVNGAGDFLGGGNFVFLGGFSPGNSPATSNFSGTYTQSSTLEIELFGTGTDEFDRIIVDGNAFLTGNPDLDVVLGAGFTPSFGDSFEFLTASAGITGDFNFTPLLLSNGLTLELLSTPTSFSLVAVPEPTSAIIGFAGLSLLTLRRRRGA